MLNSLSTILYLLLLLIFLSSCGKDNASPDIQSDPILEFNGGDCLPLHLRTDIIGYYDFSNGSLVDGSIFNAHLLNNTLAAPATDRSGNPNCAFQFDNTVAQEQFLTTEVSSQLDQLNNFSISAWYLPKASDSGVLQGIVSRNDVIPTSCPDRRGEWSLSLYDCKKAVLGHNNAAWANLDLNAQYDCEDQMARLDNFWHHAVAVKDGDAYKIYYNGKLSQIANGDAQCHNLRLAQDIGDLFIGKNFTGILDDIVIYRKALSDIEVSDLYALDACCE